MNLDDWRTDADEDVTLPKFIAAFATFVIWLIVGYLYLVLFAVAA